jgi:hypothetical protein
MAQVEIRQGKCAPESFSVAVAANEIEAEGSPSGLCGEIPAALLPVTLSGLRCGKKRSTHLVEDKFLLQILEFSGLVKNTCHGKPDMRQSLRKPSMRQSFLVAAVAAAALSIASGQAPGAENRPVIFENVNVIPMDTERAIERQAVLVRDGRIVQIGAAGEVKAPEGTLRVSGE